MAFNPGSNVTGIPLCFPWTFLGVVGRRDLVLQITRRDIVSRYRGSALGLLWSLVTPLAMLAVYTFVFSMVFNARWGTAQDGGRAEFALMLFSGLIVYQAFADCVVRAPGVILAHSSYVKKIVFPLEILPVMLVLSAFFQFLMSFAVLLLFQFMVQGRVCATLFYLPAVLLPHLFFCAGACWLLASLGAYLRDIGMIIGLFVQIFLFLSPIFYPLEAIPAAYRPFLLLNPLTGTIEQFRTIVLAGRPPDWGSLGMLLAAGWAVAWLGFAWFQKTRKGFADVV